MALARTSLRGFLTHAKHLLQVAQTKQSPVTFVIGNESADLDSISSTIVYSYIATISPQKRRPAVVHIPILNIPSVDIGLRTELLALLPKANITRQHLITLDELGDLDSLPKRLPPETTRWILVDHNALQGKLGELYGSQVVGVIDHHDDEGKVPEGIEGEPRLITPCGSCSSLIMRHLRDLWDSWFLTVSFSGAANGQGDNLIEDGAFATLWDAQVAHLPLAAILIDTACLLDENKTTDCDKEIVDYLETKIHMSSKLGKDYDRRRFWEAIQKAKEDLDPLSVHDVLRKDYKEWKEDGLTLGTGSVVKSFTYLQKKAEEEGSELVEQCRTFAEQRGAAIFAVMTGYMDQEKGFQRQVSVAAGDEKAQAVLQRFRESSSGYLELQEIERSHLNGWQSFTWQQHNLAASRKQIAPLLRKAVTSS